jgi:protein-S-isoprenylcysteine O-methyltransferase Ste14
MLGFFLQWPTIVTGVMFPILWVLYVRLAISEERDSMERFSASYLRYAEHTPRFFPQIRRSGRVYEVARPLSEA